MALYRSTNKEAKMYELLSSFLTDYIFRIPAIRMAEAQALQHSGRTFMYEFAWRAPTFEGLIGACHTMQIPFVFDNLHVPGVEGLRGPNPPQQLANTMHSAFVNFAKTGDPGWPQYELAHRETMRFDTISEVVKDPHSIERVFWEGKR